MDSTELVPTEKPELTGKRDVIGRAMKVTSHVINLGTIASASHVEKRGNPILRSCDMLQQGSDPAPFFANLFLFNYESKWVKSNSYNNYARAKRLFNTFRYIDDLLALNDNNEFGNIFQQIYPPSLVLNKENSNDQSATFLDLSISIHDSQFDYKLYDKRNAFPFDIV